MSEIEIVISDDVFETYSVSYNICTTCYIKCCGKSFPYEGWSDLTSSVLGMWVVDILKNINNPHAKFTLYFMDGPYRMDISKSDDMQLTIECVCFRHHRQVEFTFHCGCVEFLTALYEAFKKLNFIFYEKGLSRGRYERDFIQTSISMRELKKAIMQYNAK